MTPISIPVPKISISFPLNRAVHALVFVFSLENVQKSAFFAVLGPKWPENGPKMGITWQKRSFLVIFGHFLEKRPPVPTQASKGLINSILWIVGMCVVRKMPCDRTLLRIERLVALSKPEIVDILVFWGVFADLKKQCF